MRRITCLIGILLLRLWWCLNVYHVVSLFSCLVLSHTHICLVEPCLKSNPFIGIFFYCSTTSFSKCYAYFLLCSLALGLCLNKHGGVMIPFLCTLHSKWNISKSCTNIVEFLYFFFKNTHFLKSYFFFGLSDQVDCFLLFRRRLEICISSYLQSLDPQYSLISSHYSSMDNCIWFHSYYEKCSPTEEPLLYWPSKISIIPFWKWMPMGEKGLEGLKEFGFMLWFCS